jgi:NAD(P)-dependent dehydrogenase (short-subunit alcohol dehydrogenase family)
MSASIMSTLGLTPDALQGETVIITGAGGGIGLEAARALLWLGARVVIAEIDAATGLNAAERLAQEYSPERIFFVHTDVGDETSVNMLCQAAILRFGKVDAVINNATIATLGQVTDVPIEAWDSSYRVNLRGPVLLARALLPDMIRRNHGAFACVSSTGTAFMGSYESFKAAQVHLANTLDAELEGTNVAAYTIGPGLVATATAQKAVAQLAPQMGMSVEQFFELNKGAVLSVEEAGAGFALSILYAERFRGQEISSIQALKAADINFGSAIAPGAAASQVNDTQRKRAAELCARVQATLKEQSDGWKKRSLFERQWVIRDFKKAAGMPVEEWSTALDALHRCLEYDGPVSAPPLEKLAAYYAHMGDLAKGYEKDPVKLEESLRYVTAWREDVELLERMLR